MAIPPPHGRISIPIWSHPDSLSLEDFERLLEKQADQTPACLVHMPCTRCGGPAFIDSHTGVCFNCGSPQIRIHLSGN